MTSTAVSRLVSIRLVVALGVVVGCGSAGADTGAAAGGNAAAGGGTSSSAGGVAGAAGALGNQSQSGAGGATGTAGAVAGAAASPPEAGATFGGSPGTAGAAEAGGGAGGMSMPAEGGAAPCTGNSLHPGNTTVTFQYANGNRGYIVHVPTSYTGTARVPLLVDLHGSGADASSQMGTSGWNRKADATGFIVVYPNALNARWNAGTCCSPSVEQHVDDVGFLRAVVQKATADGCIDAKRIYASGLSGGGLMSYRLACEAADVFAAVAPVSGATVFSPCQPAIPASVVAFRGLSDPLVPYNGGMPLQWYFQGAKADFDQWSMLDQCSGPVTMSHGICQTKTQCAGGADVTLCSVNSGHVLYGDAATAKAAVPDVAWEIFERHSLP